MLPVIIIKKKSLAPKSNRNILAQDGNEYQKNNLSENVEHSKVFPMYFLCFLKLPTN